jgi:hypothetical protein
MNAPQTSQAPRKIGRGYIVAAVILLMMGLGFTGVAGYLRLGSESTVLRRSVMNNVAGRWDKKFAVHVGWFTMGVVRWGSHWFSVPPEARAALEACHGVEVGVYKLQPDAGAVDSAAIFSTADAAMSRRGWERAVCVVKPNQMVGIYVPRRGLSCSSLACSVVVLNDRDLVVGTARGNPQPLLEIAARKSGRGNGHADGLVSGLLAGIR